MDANDNDSAERQQCSLPEEASKLSASNIQEEINLDSSKPKKRKSTEMHMKLSSVTSTADRIGMMHCAALQDLGVITKRR